MRFIIFLIANIIISYVIEKKSKIVNIFYSIGFMIFLFISMFMCDLNIVTEVMRRCFGNTFELINQVLNENFELLGINYSAFSLTQLTFSFLILIATLILFKKIFDIKLSIRMKKIIILIDCSLKVVYKKIKLYYGKIYLHFGRLRL